MITKTGSLFSSSVQLAKPALKSFGKGMAGIATHPLTLGLTGLDLASGNQSLTGSLTGTLGGGAGSLIGEGIANKLFRGNKYMKLLGMFTGGTLGYSNAMKMVKHLPYLYKRPDIIKQTPVNI